MSLRPRTALLLFLVGSVLAACTPTGSPPAPVAALNGEGTAGSRQQGRSTLVVAIRGEPGTLNSKRGAGLSLAATRQLFNADLVRLD